jgi:hypothetical protein
LSSGKSNISYLHPGEEEVDGTVYPLTYQKSNLIIIRKREDQMQISGVEDRTWKKSVKERP